MALRPTSSEERRVPLTCKVTPATFQVIDEIFPLPGNYGRKVDMLAAEIQRLRSSSPLDRRRRNVIEQFLKDPDIMKWTDRRIAAHLNVSKSLVSLVRTEGGLRPKRTRKPT